MAQLADTSLFSDANLQAYYKGENLNDSKNSNTLTDHNTVAFNAAKFNNGFDFGATNTNKYVDIASGLSIAGNGDGSISFWLKLSAEIGSSLWVLAQHGSTTGLDRYFQVYYDYNGGTRRITADFGGNAVNYTVTLGTTDFYHVVITRDVAGNSGELYVNNVSRGTTALGTGGIALTQTTLGATAGGGNYLSGIIDDVGVFNKKLSTTEIDTLYNEPVLGSYFYMSV